MRFLFKKAEPAAAARLSAGMRVYAVGDIHGRADLLDTVLARIDADLAAHPCDKALQVFLGDYIDRGPASRDVIERLIQRRRTHPTVCLKGNHEHYLNLFLEKPGSLRQWRAVGGLETLISYDLAPSLIADAKEEAAQAAALRAALPESHQFFLKSLPLSYACGDFFFVHAGVRPGVPLDQQKEEDMLSIRNDFLRARQSFGKMIVHGHSPVLEPDMQYNRINIDTGAYITGRLTCLRIEDDRTIIL